MMFRAHMVFDRITSEYREQTCTEHALSTAALAKAFLAPLGLSSTGEIAGLLHDMGKFTREFDTYIEKACKGEKVRKGSVIHTFAGVSYLLNHFHTVDGAPSYPDIAVELLAVSIGSHHGLFDLWDEMHQSGFQHRLTYQPDYDQRAMAAFHAECMHEGSVRQRIAQASAEIMDFFEKRIGSCADSQETGFFMLGLLARLITSAVVDADRTDTRCFVQNQPLPGMAAPSWQACAEHLNAYMASFSRDTPLQRARGVFSDLCAAAATQDPGLYRLDLPTGGGKTLAALRFSVLHAKAHGLRRIIYVAPLLSIIEQNADVIRQGVGDTLPVLEHHSNVIRDAISPEEAARAELLQETWDAPIIVTTLVQLLDTLFSGRMSSVRRFHCLSESVLVVDEVQSLPTKLLSMFNCAVNFLTKCCGSTVILCSATQPPFDDVRIQHRMLPSQRLISEAVYSRYAPLFRRTKIIDRGIVSLAELAEEASSLLETADSLLIVCNTRREASDLYHKLAETSSARLFYLSAGMCMQHRKQVFKALEAALQVHERLICVSTQVIEAGIDLSFGSVIRLSAGLDNIVQSAGRCNRHGERAAPQPVRIVHLQNERLGPLREIRDAQDALDALLAEYHRAPARYAHDLTSDAAVRDYYAFLYQGMAQGAQEFPAHGQTLFEMLSTNQQFAGTEADTYWLRQAFRTAGDWFEVFDSTNEGVLVPYGEGKALIEQLDDIHPRDDLHSAASLLAQAKPYTVSMTMNQIDRMMQSGMICTLLDGNVYALNDGFYDEQTGIKEGYDSCSTLIL